MNDAPTEIRWIDGARLRGQRRPKDWIVPSMQLGPGRASMLFGARGTAKSLAAWAVGVAAAAGEPVWGYHQVPNTMQVGIVDYELGEDDSIARVQRLARGMGIEHGRLAGHLKLVCRPEIRFGSVEAVLEAFAGFGLVIIDPFSVANRGVDENSVRARDFIDTLSAASDVEKITFLFVHHEGMTPGRARGHTSIEDASGAIYRISGADPRRPRLVQNTKVPAGASRAVPNITLAVEDLDDNGEVVDFETEAVRVVVRDGHADSRRVATPDRSTEAKVRDFLLAWREAEPPSKSRVFEAVGGKRGEVFRVIEKMAERGDIVIERQGPGRPDHVRLAAAVTLNTGTRGDAE